MASSNVTDPQHNLSKVPAADETTQASHDDEKQSIKNGLEEEDEVVPSLDEVQPGVQAIEAITISWTKPWLITAYACFWCLYCVNAFQSSITGNLSPYILSDFSEAPLVTVIYTVSSALAGALLMPIARMLNLWDRGNGFLVMVTIALLGLIISAACTNVAGVSSAWDLLAMRVGQKLTPSSCHLCSSTSTLLPKSSTASVSKVSSSASMSSPLTLRL